MNHSDQKSATSHFLQSVVHDTSKELNTPVIRSFLFQPYRIPPSPKSHPTTPYENDPLHFILLTTTKPHHASCHTTTHIVLNPTTPTIQTHVIVWIPCSMERMGMNRIYLLCFLASVAVIRSICGSHAVIPVCSPRVLFCII